jgi:hypothetical protein
VTFDTEATQGMGCVGVGILADRGRGDDVYDAAGADTQGMGCLGGLGVLSDGGGDDVYRIRTSPGELNDDNVTHSGWGQGYGELGAVGLLLDEGGNDTYEAERHRANFSTGFFVQGVGLVGGVGLLRDSGGDDVYRAGRRSQGGALGGAVGVLDEAGGNDLYEGFRLCQGWAGEPGSLSEGNYALLSDGGGSDTYRCGTSPDWGSREDGHAWAAAHGPKVPNAPDDLFGVPVRAHGGLGVDRNGSQVPPELDLFPGDPTDVGDRDGDGDGVPDGYEPLLCLVEDRNRPADGTCPGDGSDYRPPSGP